MEIKQGFKKPAGKYKEPSIEKDLVLEFENVNLLDHCFFEEECLGGGDYIDATEEEFCELELAMLEVLI